MINASDGARGGLEGARAPVRSIKPPVGEKFGFLSQESLQNDIRKLHFIEF